MRTRRRQSVSPLHGKTTPALRGSLLNGAQRPGVHWVRQQVLARRCPLVPPIVSHACHTRIADAVPASTKPASTSHDACQQLDTAGRMPCHSSGRDTHHNPSDTHSMQATRTHLSRLAIFQIRSSCRRMSAGGITDPSSRMASKV